MILTVLTNLFKNINKQNFTTEEIEKIINNFDVEKLLKGQIKDLLDTTEIKGINLNSDYWAENDGMLFGPHSIYAELRYKDKNVSYCIDTDYLNDFLYDEDDDDDDNVSDESAGGERLLLNELLKEPFIEKINNILETYQAMLVYYNPDKSWLEMNFGLNIK